MTKIDKFTAQCIKDTARIEDVAADFLTLHKTGVRYTAICPFHDDHHDGNFIIYPKGNCFRCFTCDAKGGCVDLVMRLANLGYQDALRYLAKKYSIYIPEMNDFTYKPPQPPPPRPVLPTLVLPMRIVLHRQRTEGDTFCQWIQTATRWDASQRARIQQVLTEYHVGHTDIRQRQRDGSEVCHSFTMFWQIDDTEHVRDAHLMKYNPNGHRVKKEQDRYNTDWFSSLLKRDPVTHQEVTAPPFPYPQYYDPTRQEARKTLFGMHLLGRYPKGAKVNIVESEKTALLMAIAWGNHSGQVWMACCGMSNLTRERLAPIIKQGRKIVLYPDRDGIDRWKQQAERLHYDRLSINAEPVMRWWKSCDGDKADVADVVLRILNERRDVNLEQLKREYPVLREIAEKLDLAEKDNEKEA